MHKQALPFQWTLQAVGDLSLVPPGFGISGREIPATVPGCVYTDLLAAGLIDDPYFDRNELKQAWIGRTDWRYACSFDVDAALLAHAKLELVCEGLDTIAKLELNGKALGAAANMHLPHRFDLKPLLRAGNNSLSITFQSALNYAEQMRDKMGDLPHVEKHPFNFIRKMACNFGWDWGPALITAGIWQPIYMQAWNARIKSVRPTVQHADARLVRLETRVSIERAHAGELTLTASLGDSKGRVFNGSATLRGNDTEALITFADIPNPELWWPRGHGAPALHEMQVEITSPGAGGGKLDAWRGRVGLRTVKLNTAPDQTGSQFTLEVNGKPIFCKGANWIPDDCFPQRVTESRYRSRIQQAVDAHMNMLRIWGGGIYETETFYSICDEAGVMVWQDFLFACAAYPEEEPFKQLVESEARYNIARLSHHPSLVLWNGCNENIWGYADWGWKEKIGSRTWGLGYYLELLPALMRELDPARPYWPGSPYSGSMSIHPLDQKHGNMHIWDAWNSKDYTVYRNYTPRFCSEFGHQAPPTYATIRDSIPSRQLETSSPAMMHHQKAPGGNDKLHARLTEHFEIPPKFDDWLYVTQLNQARALQCGVEWFRSRAPVCMGALYWQINDCWPVTSWAAIDGAGRKKPLWYATRRFFADRLLTIQPEPDGSLWLHVLNDRDEPWKNSALVQRKRFSENGNLAEAEFTFDIAARSSARFELPKEIAQSADSAAECVVAASNSERAFWYFEIDKNIVYPEPQFEDDVSIDGSEYSIKITARSFLRDVALFVDRLDPQAEVNDQLITLLPNESFTFRFKSNRRFSREAIIQRPVFQCANWFGAGNS